LNGLKEAFNKYFPKCEKGDYWIAFPFSEKYFESAVLSVREKEKFIELKTNSSLEVIFEKKSLIAFWADVKEEYSEKKSFQTKHLIFCCRSRVLYWWREPFRHTRTLKMSIVIDSL